MKKNRIDLFNQLMETHEIESYGGGHRKQIPSKFWPDVETNTFEEIIQWKNDLRKEQEGEMDFDRKWGLGSTFKRSIDIELLLSVFRNVNGEYFDNT